MKQFLSIIALCAIAVGLIVLLTVDDGSHAITSKQSEAAKLSQQGANQSQHQELARNIVTDFLDDSESLEIKPLPLIESVQQTAVIQAAFFLPDNGAPSFEPLPRLEPKSLPKQWDVRQVTFLSPAEPATEPSKPCLLYTSPSPRDATLSRMPSSA